MAELTSVDVTVDGGLDESRNDTPKACCSCVPRILRGLLRRKNCSGDSDPNTSGDAAESQQNSGRRNNMGSHQTVSACQVDKAKSLGLARNGYRSTITDGTSAAQQAVDGGKNKHSIPMRLSDPTSQNLQSPRLSNNVCSQKTSHKSVSAKHRILSRMRGSSNSSSRSSSCSSSCIGTSRPQGNQQLWSPAVIGSLYVFEGDKVPALMEFFTSASSPDFSEIQCWLSAWFASEEGQNPIDPQFVPLVFHVTDLSAETQENLPGNAKFTQRRLAYEKSWESEGTHSEERYSGYGTCLIINGECANKEEIFRKQQAGMSVAVRSRSPGALKILLADESTVLITFQPLSQCRHMIGQLVANVALVGCGGPCSGRGHASSGAPTHHSTVLDTVQVQLEKREGNAYHVAGLNMTLPDAANFHLPGIVSYGLVIWVTHGYVDSTPIAVGYCGLEPP